MNSLKKTLTVFLLLFVNSTPYAAQTTNLENSAHATLQPCEPEAHPALRDNNAVLDSVDELINQARALSKEAYLYYDKDRMLEAHSVFEKAFKLNKSNLLSLYYLTLVDYKLLEMSMQNGSESLFDEYYEGAISNAEILEANKNFSAEGKILLSAIYMMKIATSSLSAVTLSPKIHSLLDEAQGINPAIPYSYAIRGMMKYNTPGIFGGSYEEALKNFNVAVKLLQNDEDVNNHNPDWGYVEMLAWIGRTQEQLDNNEAAHFTYKKALSVEPNFGWVRYSLLPELEKKIADNE